MIYIRDYLEQQLTVSDIHTLYTLCKEVIVSVCVLQAQFGGGVHFNGRLEGSERIPNTCNVSIVGEGLQSMLVCVCVWVWVWVWVCVGGWVGGCVCVGCVVWY